MVTEWKYPRMAIAMCYSLYRSVCHNSHALHVALHGTYVSHLLNFVGAIMQHREEQDPGCRQHPLVLQADVVLRVE